MIETPVARTYWDELEVTLARRDDLNGDMTVARYLIDYLDDAGFVSRVDGRWVIAPVDAEWWAQLLDAACESRDGQEG